MNKTDIKNSLSDYIGCDVTIKYNLGRNKYESYRVKIKELYNNIFLVELNDKSLVKSFSYNDVITKTIKIEY